MVWWPERIQFMQKVQNTFGNCRFLLILLLHDDYGDVGLWVVSITKMIKKMLLWPQLCDSYQSYLNSLWTGMGHIRCFCPSNRLINVTWLSNSVIFTFSGWSVLPGRHWVSPVIPSLPGQSSSLPGGTETTAGMWPLYDWVGPWATTGITGVIVSSARLP